MKTLRFLPLFVLSAAFLLTEAYARNPSPK